MIFNEIINFINFYYYVHSNFEFNVKPKIIIQAFLKGLQKKGRG